MSDEITTPIDTALGCLSCGGPLGDSPSDEWCGQDCQADWHAARAHALDEPEITVDTLREFFEIVLAAWRRLIAELGRWWTETVVPALQRLFRSIGEAARQLGIDIPAPGPDRTERMKRALEAKRTRNTGPVRKQRPPRTLHRC